MISNQKNQLVKINILNIFFVLFFVISIIFLSLLFPFNNQVFAADLEPGEVRVTKTAKPVPDMVNQWDVTVRVDGRENFPPPSTDIVLVIDMSNSMVPNSASIPPRTKDRLTAAKEAAKKFVNQVLKDGYDNKISLVTFESDVTIHKFSYGASMNEEFVDSAHRQLIIDKINSLTINLDDSKTDPYKGGTFTQGAIRESTNQLEKSTALNRDIVLISDGVPTFNYDIKAPYNQKGHMEQLVGKEPITYNYYSTKKGIPESYYDYTKRIGEGKNFTSKAPESWGTPAGKDRLMTNSAYAALDEAGFTKAKKFGSSVSDPLVTEFYTVGIDLNEEGDEFEIVGQQTLKGIASSEDNYFDTSSDDLDDVLSGIGGKIIGAIKSADIIDPMGEGFKLSDKNSIKVTQGDKDVKVANGLETIHWDFGALMTPISNKPDEDVMYAEMTYRIEATIDVIQALNTAGFAPTNGRTTIKYVAYDKQNNYKEKEVEKEFLVPEVKPTIVSVEKKVIDTNGDELTNKDEKFNFSFGNDEYTVKDTFELYATEKYQIVHPWKANKNYSISEKFTENQKYTTVINVNKQEIQGSSANFSFKYDLSNNSYLNQKIEVCNQKVDKILHLRQVVVDPNEELVVPTKAYFFGINDDSQKVNLVAGSSTKNTSAEVNEKLFTTYKMDLKNNQTTVSLSDVIPEYYKFYGYILTKSTDNLATEHISSNVSKLKNDLIVLLDYKIESEYWLTVFIQPRFNGSENYPRPYSWSYKTNQFGQ